MAENEGTTPPGGSSVDDAFASARERVARAESGAEPGLSDIEGDDPIGSDARASDAPTPRAKPGRKAIYRTPEEAKIGKNARDRANRAGADPDAAVAAAIAAHRAGQPIPEIVAPSARHASQIATRIVNRSRESLADELATSERERAKLAQEVAELKAAKINEAAGMLAGMLAQTATTAFDIIAARRGAHWKLTKEESGKLGDAVALPLAEHFDKIAEYSPWIVAGVTLFNVIVPRVMTDAAIADGDVPLVMGAPPVVPQPSSLN